MIGLAVYLNGKKLTVAGAEDLSVLNTIIAAAGTLGKKTAPLGKRPVDIHLSVGGLTNRGDGIEDEHLRWINLRRIKVGDRISVRVVRVDKADQHASATPAIGTMQKINAARRRRLEKGMTGQRKK